MLQKIRHKRICRYDKSEMVPVSDNGAKGFFIALHLDSASNTINLNRGYTFSIYECQLCDYIEFGDEAAPTGMADLSKT